MATTKVWKLQSAISVRFPETKVLLISLVLLVVFALLFKFLYNIFLHPLRAFKGPTTLIASDLPLAVLQLRGTGHHALKRAHDQYGDVVRIAPNTVSFIDPSAWHDIYGYRKGQGGAMLPRDPQFYNEMLLDKKSITLASDADALPIRRAMNPAFSHKSLLDQEPMIRSHNDRLLEQLQAASYDVGEKKYKTVDICKWLTFSMFDINSDFAFDEDMGCVASGSFHEWVQFIVDYFYAATLLHQCHKFPPLNHLLAFCIPKSLRDKHKKHTEASLKRVRRRINKEPNHPDFMQHFLHHAEKEGISMPVIEAQASVVILAGSETTSIALTAAVYHILNNREVYEKLTDEIRNAFATASEIKLSTVLKSLPYLEAVVQETLRIHTPLANGFTRVVSDPEGARVSGRWVPKRTIVTINHYCCNTSAQNFREPLSFIPERWLGDPAFADDKREAVQPFSVGPRNCPGKTFALYNIKLKLANLLWKFDMELDKSAGDWATGQKVFNGWVQPALPIYLKTRSE